MNTSPATEISKLLDQLSGGETLENRLEALPELIKRKALHGVRDDPRLKSALEHLGTLAASDSDDEARLRSIAALSRIRQVKSLSKTTGGSLSAAVVKPLPGLTLLKDSDDRYYVASALSLTKEPWILEYAGYWAVQEKQAERSRQALMAVLFRRLPSLSAVFEMLARHLKALKPETKNPGDSVARRLQRVIQALRPTAVNELIDPGFEAGRRLQEMLRAAFSGVGRPESLDVTESVVDEIGALLHDLARTQISLVADAALYAALDVPRAWVQPPEWRYFAEKLPSIKLVAKDIREALTLLAKQGVTDSQLYEQLVSASGSRESAAASAADVADRHPEIDESTRQWLKAGGKVKRRVTSTALEESRELSADPALGELMVNGEHLREGLAGVSEDLRSELRILEPSLADPIDTLANRCRAVLSDISALASKRQLVIRGGKGDVVDYSPALHELVGGHRQGVRKVKIVQPMVLRQSATATGDVVRKALVEES